jgi:hypothetical protein
MKKDMQMHGQEEALNKKENKELYIKRKNNNNN